MGGRWGAQTLRWGAAGTAAAERVTEGDEDGGEEGDDEAVVVVERTAPHWPADGAKSVCFSGT